MSASSDTESLKRSGNVSFSPTKIGAMITISAAVLTTAGLWFGLKADVRASQKEIIRLLVETETLRKSVSEVQETLMRIDWRTEELWKNKHQEE